MSRELLAARRAVWKAVTDYNARPDFEVGEVLRDAAIELSSVSAAYLDADELLSAALGEADEMLLPGQAADAGLRLREAFLDLHELLTRGGAGPVAWSQGLAIEIEPVPADETPADEDARVETRFGGDAR